MMSGQWQKPSIYGKIGVEKKGTETIVLTRHRQMGQGIEHSANLEPNLRQPIVTGRVSYNWLKQSLQNSFQWKSLPK